MAFLGHIVFSDGIRVDTQDIEAVQSCPIPTSVTNIRSFLDFDNYYKMFVEGFVSINMSFF